MYIHFVAGKKVFALLLGLLCEIVVFLLWFLWHDLVIWTLATAEIHSSPDRITICIPPDLSMLPKRISQASYRQFIFMLGKTPISAVEVMWVRLIVII